MSRVDAMVEALGYMMTVEVMALIVFIAVIGIVLGAIPGIGQALAMAVFVPLTLTMEPVQALVLMAVLFSSSTFGGAIAAILIRVPGTPSSIATVLDGYPLTQQGKSSYALGIAAMSSFMGLLVGLVALMLLAPEIARYSTLLKSIDVFWLTVLGFSTVSAVSQGSLPKSLASLTIGVMIAMVGVDPQIGQPRFTFGIQYLQAGLDLIVVLVGLFSIPQVLDLVNRKSITEVEDIGGSAIEGIIEVLKHPFASLRGTLIGTFVGSIPGVGATAANFLSYMVALNSSKEPEEFGSGKPEGVIAAETSNNGSALGALIPTMALAIPGSAGAAIFLSVMIVHGLTPGPTVFQGSMPYVIYFSIILGGVVTFAVGVFGAKYFAKVTRLSSDIIIPSIIVFSLVGAFAIRNNIYDVFIALGAGFLGYVMIKKGYSIVALVLALVLAPISEQNFQRGVIISGGDLSYFFSTDLSKVFILLSILVLLSPILINYRK